MTEKKIGGCIRIKVFDTPSLRSSCSSLLLSSVSERCFHSTKRRISTMASLELQIQEIAEYPPCAHLSARKVASLFSQTIEKINSSADNLSAAMNISGILNLTSSSCISSLGTMKENELRFYIVGDSNGKYPAQNGDTYVKVHDSVKLLHFLVSDSSLYVNVGDIIAVMGYKNALAITKVCRVLPLNDAKAGLTAGVITPGDKTTQNTANSNASAALNAINIMVPRYYREDNYNINNIYQPGIYLYGRTGRSMPENASDEYYIVIVETVFSNGSYNVCQKAYSVTRPGRSFYRIIVTNSLTNYEGSFGEWIQTGWEHG